MDTIPQEMTHEEALDIVKGLLAYNSNANLSRALDTLSTPREVVKMTLPSEVTINVEDLDEARSLADAITDMINEVESGETPEGDQYEAELGTASTIIDHSRAYTSVKVTMDVPVKRFTARVELTIEGKGLDEYDLQGHLENLDYEAYNDYTVEDISVRVNEEY